MKWNFERKLVAGLLLAAAIITGSSSAAIVPVPEKVVCAVADRQNFTEPDQLQLTGWLGSRIQANESNRLVKVDLNPLLEGFRHRPSVQTYDGEHIGKWLHAATLAWVNTGDPALRQKLDEAASELIKCQEADGYLGTYLDKDRWTEWDVWSHKYNLIGLIAYMRYTGNMEPLPACKRMGDLLCNTFGDDAGKRDIIKAGWHDGLAPTSVLEPMVLLYRLTGEQRYLDFCKYILRAWEEPGGPKVISTLLTQKRVDKVGDAKAYEMLSCLNGALEYYRTVGDPKILEACMNSWQDIVKNRLYITGASSYGEVFHDDYDFPNVANVGETCVTVTWIQFNAQLLRLTGEARFAEQLEHVVLNQLFGAETCDGSAWGYYVQMEGKKPFTSRMMNGNCCLSSGPRGIALIPTFAVCTDADGVVVNLYDAGAANLSLKDGASVKLMTDTLYPADERIQITVGLSAEKNFAIKLRLPERCQSNSVAVNGQDASLTPGVDGYVAVQRSWKDGDRIELRFKLEPRVIVGDHKNNGKLAVLYGPLVLTEEADLLGNQGAPLNAVALPSANLADLAITPEPAPAKFHSWSGAQLFRINAVRRHHSQSASADTPFPILLIPFADAGNTGSAYKVWIPTGFSQDNLLQDEKEDRSRSGNVSGSITDGDIGTFVVTYDGKSAPEDWYSVTLSAPAEVSQVVFVHGKTFHDGGWFDASGGLPQVQVQTISNGDWETVGQLTDYPATTATQAASLTAGEKFTCHLPKPTKVFGVRVLGKPASGDNPKQAFSSCGELLAY